jgi:hypothetical protein
MPILASAALESRIHRRSNRAFGFALTSTSSDISIGFFSASVAASLNFLALLAFY